MSCPACFDCFERLTEKVTQTVIKETGELLKSSDRGESQRSSVAEIRQFAAFASERVPLSKTEVAQIKALSNANDEASLILLGFKPVDAVPITHTIEYSYFVYPNDEAVRGSTEAFAHLHASMLRKKVLAIGELLTRSTATSRLVALYPQQEFHREDDDYQIRPPGMIVVMLPFEDDIRTMEPDAGDTATEEIVDKAEALIRHLKLEDVELGESFQNAALVEFWRYIESVALVTNLPPKEEFDTEVNEEDILDAAGSQLEALRDSLPADIKQENVKVAKKRKAPEPVEDDSGMDWAQLYTTDELSSCKVADLKKYLRSVGARLSGKKEELVLRVSQSIKARIDKGEL